MSTDAFREFILEQLAAPACLRGKLMFGRHDLLAEKTDIDGFPRSSARNSGRCGSVGSMGEKGRESMTTQGLKQIIRQRILAQREQLPAALRSQLSVEIAQRIGQLPDYQEARVVMGYMNFGTEFESEILLRQALADGKTLLLPRVNSTTNELDVFRVTNLVQDLAPGTWNIREPLPDRCEKVCALEEVDFILLPGVAFGRDGARLGYGGGFYDKLLARLHHHPALVAGTYSMQLVEHVPQQATDRKVQWLVTENETLHCAV